MINPAQYIETDAFTDWHVHTELVGTELRDSATLRNNPVARVVDLGANPVNIVASDRVLFAGAFLTAPGGYPSDREWATPGSWRFIESSTDVQACVAEMVSYGASFIKVALNTVAGPVLSDELLCEVVTATTVKKVPVVVHAEGAGQAVRARLAGAKYLAHTPFSEKLSDTEIAEQAKQLTWISTLDIHGWGEKTEQYHIAIDNLSRFARQGGRVLYGTDMGNGPTVTGLSPRELGALREAGLSDKQILMALTGGKNEPKLNGPKNIIPVEDGKLCFELAQRKTGQKLDTKEQND